MPILNESFLAALQKLQKIIFGSFGIEMKLFSKNIFKY
jgi:hypothetical protein